MAQWQRVFQRHMHMQPPEELPTLVALNRASRFWSFPGLHEFKEEYVKQKERRDLYFEKRELERLIREKDESFFPIDNLKNLLLNYEHLTDDWTKKMFLDWCVSDMTHEQWACDMDEYLRMLKEEMHS